MANHGKTPQQRAKSYWSAHYSKPSRAARTAKRAKARAEKA